jgi:hypothetical protein
VAEAAAAALRKLGPQVEQQILEGIRAGDSLHKRALLPFISSGSGTREVVACLRDADADVRVLACEALGRTGAVAAVGALFPFVSPHHAYPRAGTGAQHYARCRSAESVHSARVPLQ